MEGVGPAAGCGGWGDEFARGSGKARGESGNAGGADSFCEWATRAKYEFECGAA